MKTAFAGIFLVALLATQAAAFSQTEFHLQYGKHKNPFSTATQQTFVFTVQQAAGWKLGDSFFFIDYLDDDERDGFNDRDFYGEWYPTLSFGKLTNKELHVGPIRDFALIAGVNVGGDANVVKYLPGLRASWDLPGFLFLNTDLTAYIDDNTGYIDDDMGGKYNARQTDNSFILDVNWALPINIGSLSLAIVGHAEYLGSQGENVKDSILAQPQFTWDLGKVVGAPNQLMVGIEYQYWLNKLGTDEDESTAQLLLVWRL